MPTGREGLIKFVICCEVKLDNRTLNSLMTKLLRVRASDTMD